MQAVDLVRRLRTFAFVVGITSAVLVFGASPASADPAKPTNYESIISSVVPPVSGLEADVVGGDSFMSVSVHGVDEVIVLGYENESYLRFATDGTVEENIHSPAVALNQSRYGATLDAQSNAKAAPEWRVVATNGAYVWHDHRIHWMTHSLPPQLNGKSTGKVLDWNIPLLVNGQAAAINGELYRRAPPSSLPHLVLGILGAVAAAFAMRRARFAAAVLLSLVSLVGFVVSLTEQLSIPAGAGRRVSFYIIPALSAICGLVALARPRSIYAFVLKVACALIMPLWVFLNAKALTNARLPGDVSPIALRVTVVGAAATVVAFAVIDFPRDLRSAAVRKAALNQVDS